MLDHIDHYTKADLRELSKLKLVDRIDKRFLINKELALDLLENIDKEYKLLCVDGDYVIGYETNYYDTVGFSLFNDHLTGRGNRYNIRVRSYSTSHDNYIDIKESMQNRKTSKYITPFTSISKFDKMVKEYTPYIYPELEDKLAIHFNRFTFINLRRREKVTIDLDLGFSTEDSVKNLSKIAIIEVKRDKKYNFSPFMKLLKKYKAKEFGISKYCLGVFNMYPDLSKELISSLNFSFRNINELLA